MIWEINTRDRATTGLQKLAAEVESTAINDAIGASMVSDLVNHFLKLNDTRGNKLGGDRTNFYAQAAESAHWTVAGDLVRASVDRPVGLRQRMQGGTILPTHGKYLTIPAIAQTYGRLAGEFPDLVPLIRWKDGGPRAIALVQAEQTPIYPEKPARASGGVRRGRTVGGTGKTARAGAATYEKQATIFYWLVKSVTQDPDPTVVPNEAMIVQHALDTVDRYFHGLQGEVRLN